MVLWAGVGAEVRAGANGTGLAAGVAVVVFVTGAGADWCDWEALHAVSAVAHATVAARIRPARSTGRV